MEQGQGLRLEPSRGEEKCVCRSAVEPLRVVDQADQGSLLGRVGKQAEHTERDAKAVAERLVRECERGAQRGRLRTGERVDCSQQWTEDLVQGRERELGFGASTATARRIVIPAALLAA